MRKLIVVLLTLALLTSAACGFAEEFVTPPSAGVGIANPWQETTPEDLLQIYGYEFGIPGEAEDIAYYINEALQLAEMRFDIGSTLLNARVAAIDPEDISGMYYDHWDVEEHCLIDVCMWYDPERGLTYSVTAESDDLDGFDIITVAEQVYIPGESGNTSDGNSVEDEAEEDPIEDEWDSGEADDYDAFDESDAFEADEYYGEADESEAYDHMEEGDFTDDFQESEMMESFYEENDGEETSEY